MKKKFIKIGMIALALTFFNVDASAQKKKKKNKKSKMEKTTTAPVELKTEIDSVSYAIGMNMIGSIKRDFPEANFEAFIAGAKAASIEDSTSLIKPEDIQGVIEPYFKKKQAEMQAEQAKGSESAIADGLKFLAENKSKEGVITTESGLQYTVIKEGTGAQPDATSNVEVHYHGTTPDGTVFDSSVDRNKSISFGLNQVIKGWTEGVQLMKEGAKYKFFIPQELAYGANAPGGGSGPIQPFMPLVFEVELININ
jgi:FKBP-type peptidyl-prolyl cis-trans isomerase